MFIFVIGSPIFVLLILIFSLFMAFPKKFDFPFGFSDIHEKFFKKQKPKKIKRKPVPNTLHTKKNEKCLVDNPYVTAQRLRRENRALLKKAIDVFNKSTFSMVENVKISPSIVEIEYKMLSENVKGNCSPMFENQYDEYGNMLSSELLGYLIQIDYGSKYNFDVIAHELAHVVMFELVGKHGHDEMWQRAYEACGGQEKYWDGHNESKYNEVKNKDRPVKERSLVKSDNYKKYHDEAGFVDSWADENLDNWEYMGKFFINIHTGMRVYHEDQLFHILKRKMII